MKFIGRKEELEKLNSEFSHNNSFVVIYGRRRVGKTTLIKEFLKKKRILFSGNRRNRKSKYEKTCQCHFACQ